ncbi:hypothetical protein B0J11DRAFT_473636 [Dendryphion nanum]|uniref:DUF6603 domain-containing protein n=1 Tax=Dendryphion nanum TaxID=256645 RepID=A0A9P9D1P5_9PLEO|nr:hypothetical protein B0J11DRAFT_473636 [Dendryphion nanum]
MFPEFEDYRILTPVGVTKLPKSFSLRSFACFKDAPDQLPTEVTDARIFLSSSFISFEGVLEPQEPSSDSPVARLKITEIDLGLSYEFSEAKPSDETSGFSASLDIRAEITPPPGSDPKAVPAKLTGSIDYESAVWTLHASVYDLKATYLLQFFSKEVQSAAISILEPFELREFNINYQYSSGKPSKFSVDSIIKIGDLRLDLGYHHEGTAWKWDFHAQASLEMNRESTEFGSVIDSMLGPGDHGIPEFVRTIKLDLGPKANSVGLMMAPDFDTKSLIFIFVVAINDFRLQFIQVKYSKEAETGDKVPPTKRVLLASIRSLPKTDVPLIGDISQPFDEAMFLWAQKNGSEGLDENEVKAINRIMEAQGKTWPGLKPLRYKEEKKPTRPNALLLIGDTASSNPPPVVIKSGMHFMLMLKDEKNIPKVVVDYVFGSGKPKPKPKPSIASRRQFGSSAQSSALLMADEKDNGEAGGMSEYKKTAGPLAIKNIGFEYAEKKLSIKMDASIALGPMSFDLYGFAIELDFSDSAKFDLDNLPTPRASLGGLAVGYDKSPLRIEGGLTYTKTPEMTLFAGGILIQYLPWLFAAAGFYGDVKFKPDQPEKKTAFVYAMLEGPLVTFSFGQINGLKGGFGYNSSLRYPTAADIPNFPLIPNPSQNAMTDKEGPKNAIMSIVASGWVTPTDESFWFAAGVKVTAFQMLEIDALIAVQWGASVRLGLFALATATVPKPLPGVKKGFTFAFIQLGLTAVIDVGAGSVAIDGQLTPASYILHKDCKLTGGFAFYTWFDPSPHQGDWVFSLGGYHRMFKPPPHYPVPPRLAITWKFSNAIFIRGEAYFAVTPQMCMGGGRWNVSLSLGPLRAFYECFVDFLVNFKPFHFRADGGLSVGVRFTLDMWLVTINISVEISAQLYIEGPPVRGTVHVDFWVFGFNIDFGGKADPHEALTLDQFEKFVIDSKENSNAPSAFDTITCYTPIARSIPQPALGGQGRAVADPRPPEKAAGFHVLNVTSGLIPSGDSKSTPSGDVWLIRRAVFAFTVSCKFPVSRIEVKTGGEDPGPDTHTIQGTGKSMYARPMRDSKPMGSTMTIKITADAPPKALSDPPPAKVPHWDRNVGIVKKMPAAIWGPYSRETDPSFNSNNRDMLNSGKENTVELLCGVNIMAPKQLTSQADTMKAFDYEKTMVQPVSDGKGPFKCEGLECQEPSFQPLQPIMKDKDVDSAQWGLVEKTWRAKGKKTEADVDIAKIWQDFGLEELGWDKGKFDGTAGEAFGADVPVELLNEFPIHYLWPPNLNLGEKKNAVF